MDDASLRWAEVTVGAVHVGIPAAAVVQALAQAADDAATGLPRRQGALCGIVDWHGALVPVVDLGRWVDVGRPAPGHDARRRRVLVLRDAGRLIALRVDAVGGLVDVAPDVVTRLHHDDGADEVFHSAARSPETGQVLSLLDVGRLATLAAAWSGGAVADAPAAALDAATAAGTRPYALLQAGGVRLGVPAGDLTEVIPLPALARFGGGIDGAWCAWRGRHLPVLAADAFGAATRTPTLLAVLEHDGLALGVPVDAALQLAGFNAALPAPGAVTSTTYDRDGAVDLLDTAALFARSPEAALSRRDDAAPATAAQVGRGSANAVAYIVFDAAGAQAAAIDTVAQVLPLAAPPAATMPWDGRSIPVVDLRAPAQAETGAGHVLVTHGAAGHVACVVARVLLLVPPGAGRIDRMGAGGAPVEFITTGDGAERASYRTVDLAALAA